MVMGLGTVRVRVTERAKELVTGQGKELVKVLVRHSRRLPGR